MGKRTKKTLLFICTGNTCRSPMAAGYFKKLLEEGGVKNWEVKTAGVMTVAGLLPTPETVLLLDEIGVDIRKHRSVPLTPEMIRKTDLILGFTPFHVQSAIRMCEEARGKTFLLKEYVGADPRRARIPDPMGCTLEVYRKVFNEIMKACEKLYEKEKASGNFVIRKSRKEKKTEPKAKKKAKAKRKPKAKVAGTSAKSSSAQKTKR